MDEDALFRELGARVSAVTEDPARGAAFTLSVAPSSPFESGIDLNQFGRRFFDNLSQAAYNVVCGTAEGAQQVHTVINSGIDTLAATIAAVLVAHLAIAAAVATAVAAVIVKIFYKAGNQTLCQTWKDNLPATT